MACGDYSTLREAWTDGAFLDANYCWFANQLGGELTQLIVFGTLIAGLYAYSRDPSVALVLMVIFGGVMIAPLPAEVTAFVTIIAVVLAGGTLYLLSRRARGGLA